MMNGVIVQSLQTLDEVLLELRSLGQVTEAQLHNDWRTRRAIERDLQVLIEIMIDVSAAHRPGRTHLSQQSERPLSAACNLVPWHGMRHIIAWSSFVTSSCIIMSV